MGRPTRNLITVRVDKDIWRQVETLLPRESNETRSRLLFNFSLLNAESKLRKADNVIGEFVYGTKKKKV